VVGRRRDDIQGLRAVAVLLVVLDHAGVPFVRGGYVGVDVFFVLSGFLITAILLSRAAAHGRVSLREFYMRRARRILPAAALTLVATDVVAYHLLNFVRARQVVSDSIWASLFTANVHFARQGSDYFAQGQPPSPLQHFWTLAVEEQFYLVWPAVFSAALFGVVLRRRRSVRRRDPRGPISRASTGRLLVVVLAAALASLVWSIHYTRVMPTAAYFSTFARAWELALGAVVAIGASSLSRAPRQVWTVLGWLGMATIVCAAVAFSGTTPFPGSAALLPTVGAALVIAAGVGRRRGPLDIGRALSLSPFRYVGDRSYALYLWHWAVLMLAVEYAGHDFSVGVKLVLIAGAFLLSIGSYRLLENPIRRMRGPLYVGAVVAGASAAAALVVAGLTLHLIDPTAARLESAAAAVRPAALTDPSSNVGARARPKALPAVVAAVRAAERGAPLPAPLTPAVGDLRGDFYLFPDGCIADPGETSSKRLCRLGDKAGSKTIAVIGDSHADMWMPTILRMAMRDGWAVVPFVKLGCIPDSWLRGHGACATWYLWAVQHAAALHPQVALVVGSWSGSRTPRAAIAGVAAASATMKRAAASVVVVGDAPMPGRSPVDCLLSPHATMKTCTPAATGSQLRIDDAVAARARKLRVGFVSTRGWFCARPGNGGSYLCPLVINHTVAWVDRGHIGQTYGLELAGPFRTAFRRELFR
jgi:peptidoglycan/LPS O-acetylase OafA/YrhL